jgi:tetratricopeptide (TPR) repeat protein
MGEGEKVFDVYREAVEIERELGDPREIANALYNYALAVVFGSNPHQEALVALEEAESLYQGLGDLGGLGDVEWGLGNSIAFLLGDYEQALDHWRSSIDYYRRAGNEFGLGWGLYEVGSVSRIVGDNEEAWRANTQGLRLFAGHGDVTGVVMFISLAAGIAINLGDTSRAHRLAGSFHSLRISSGTDIVRNDLNRIEGLEFETLEALSGEEAIPYREGRAMGFDQAVEYALAGPTDP